MLHLFKFTQFQIIFQWNIFTQKYIYLFTFRNTALGILNMEYNPGLSISVSLKNTAIQFQMDKRNFIWLIKPLLVLHIVIVRSNPFPVSYLNIPSIFIWITCLSKFLLKLHDCFCFSSSLQKLILYSNNHPCEKL